MDKQDDFKKGLGKQIKTLRKRKGFTQPQLGALLGKDFQEISRIERGMALPSAFYIKKIADALEVDMNTIFDFRY